MVSSIKITGRKTSINSGLEQKKRELLAAHRIIET